MFCLQLLYTEETLNLKEAEPEKKIYVTMTNQTDTQLPNKKRLNKTKQTKKS